MRCVVGPRQSPAFHGISGIFSSSRVQRKNCLLYIRYNDRIYVLYTGVLFFLWKLHLFFILTCDYYQGLTPIRHWWLYDTQSITLSNPLMLFSSVQDKNLKEFK